MLLLQLKRLNTLCPALSVHPCVDIVFAAMCRCMLRYIFPVYFGKVVQEAAHVARYTNIRYKNSSDNPSTQSKIVCLF